MSGVEEAPRPDIVERLEAFRARGIRLQGDLTARLDAVQARLGDAVEPSPVHADVTLDERGYPIAAELTDATGAGTPDQVRAALTAAFLAARAERPRLPAEAVDPLMSVLQSAAADPQHADDRIAEAGKTVWNDLGQAGVTAVFGDVTAVHAREDWIQRNHPAAIAAEILALAQRAATASDMFGRFTEEDSRG
ncbi:MULTISPECIES: hypothetical protein [unclassified Microbacterium]|uniref:hypothetical protein n=1 Tax=unclassified Microbacterium TaxID=2609290 RepID=UPI00214CB7C2|nr:MULTISPECIES: hypothetical protein [unclassified Microbacterium]MCR2784677.1 hypothetical protein [Microbacterium sp. zg.B96]MDL5352872.1 hypothetical protein [Microbacterium sp. zg-YB36]WIM16218.1 hypothetical protein QNO11_00880 [Microbacterium sp. zg-B96]